jgi:Glutamine synthetase
VLRNSVLSDWYKDLLAMCEAMDMGIEGLHTETGAGVLEARLRVSDGLDAADKAALFKLFTKVLAQKRDWLATFMAKWSKDWPGCGGHMHMSLWKDGKPAFFDDKAPHRMSRTMRQFVGGQQALMPELLGMVASTVNAYRRLIPGFWAPTVSTWGVENRTCALRVIPGSAQGDPRGVSHRRGRREPVPGARAAVGSACGASRTSSIPASRSRATATRRSTGQMAAAAHADGGGGRLKASKPARELFGDAFVDHYSATRDWEEREFRKAITDWELERYMEII